MAVKLYSLLFAGVGFDLTLHSHDSVRHKIYIVVKIVFFKVSAHKKGRTLFYVAVKHFFEYSFFQVFGVSVRLGRAHKLYRKRRCIVRNKEGRYQRAVLCFSRLGL